MNRQRAVSFAAQCILLLSAALMFGCPERAEAPGKPHGPVVARVGHAYLTLEELQASIPHEYSSVITREQNLQYVRQWINTELLYQEALRIGVDNEPHIRARLDKMKKDLLSAEVISRASHGGAEVSDLAVREYYESNREQFVREVYTVRYEAIVVDSLSLAWDMRRNATHETFRSLARAHSKFQMPGGDGDSPPYVPLDAIPPTIRAAVMQASIPSITGPYRTEDGFYILRVVGRYDKGTIASIDEVRDDIVSRLSNITQKGETERLISDIRSRSEVEFNMDLVPGVDVPQESAGQD